MFYHGHMNIAANEFTYYETSSSGHCRTTSVTYHTNWDDLLAELEIMDQLYQRGTVKRKFLSINPLYDYQEIK